MQITGAYNFRLWFKFGLTILISITASIHSVYAQDNGGIVGQVYALHDEVSDPSKQVGNINPDSLPSLPIGLVKEINGTKYIIAIDSAEFTPQGAYFNAYMALEFPGAEHPIAFAAKHIKFNPKGVVGGELAKLQLVSEHTLSLGPNSELPQLQIFNSLGVLVESKALKQNKNQLTLSIDNLEKGIYILRMIKGNITLTKRFTKI